jgi:hypothetical protein
MAKNLQNGVTTADACRRLQRSRSFVERLARDGILRTWQVAGRVLFDVLDLERVAEQMGLTRTGSLAATYGSDGDDDTVDEKYEDRTDKILERRVNRFAEEKLRELSVKYLPGRK